MKQVIELVVRMPEFVKAKLPKAHILEGTLSFLPWLKPIGTNKADDQKYSSNKARDGSNEKLSWNKIVTIKKSVLYSLNVNKIHELFQKKKILPMCN